MNREDLQKILNEKLNLDENLQNARHRVQDFEREVLNSFIELADPNFLSVNWSVVKRFSTS